MTSKVVFDIETVGYDFESLDQDQWDYLLKYAKSDEEIKVIKEGLGLFPVSGRIVAIAMHNVDSGKGVVFFTPSFDHFDNCEIEEDDVRYIACDEKEILERFWDVIVKYDIYITFNGRAFDIPFIRIRSAILGVKCPVGLMTPRFRSGFASNPHIDLLEELTFNGTIRKFNLDFYCKAFGIPSPKKEINGHDVPQMMRESRGLDVARYCYGDVLATAELFKRWNESFPIV